MTAPNITSGAVPQPALGESVVGFFQTTATCEPGDPVEFSLQIGVGAAWTSRLTTPDGGVLEHSWQTPGQVSTQFAVRFVGGTAAETTTVWVRAIGLNGLRGAAYPVVLRSYEGGGSEEGVASYPVPSDERLGSKIYSPHQSANRDGTWFEYTLVNRLQWGTTYADQPAATLYGPGREPLRRFETDMYGNLAVTRLDGGDFMFVIMGNNPTTKTVKLYDVDPLTGDRTQIASQSIPYSQKAPWILRVNGTTGAVMYSLHVSSSSEMTAIHDVFQVDSDACVISVATQSDRYGPRYINWAGTLINVCETGTVLFRPSDGTVIDVAWSGHYQGHLNGVDGEVKVTDVRGSLCAALVSKGYRGAEYSLKIKTLNSGDLDFTFPAGRNVAQLIATNTGFSVGMSCNTGAPSWGISYEEGKHTQNAVGYPRFLTDGSIVFTTSNYDIETAAQMTVTKMSLTGTVTTLGTLNSTGTGTMTFTNSAMAMKQPYGSRTGEATGGGDLMLPVGLKGTTTYTGGGVTTPLPTNAYNRTGNYINAVAILRIDGQTGAAQTVSHIASSDDSGTSYPWGYGTSYGFHGLTTDLTPGSNNAWVSANQYAYAAAFADFDLTAIPAAFNLGSGNGVIWSPGPSTTRVEPSFLLSMDDQGVFGALSATGATEPPPAQDDGFIPPPDLPSGDWPEQADEDTSISVLLTSRNPDDPDGLAAVPGWFTGSTTPSPLPAPNVWTDLTGTPLNGGAFLDWEPIAGASGYRVYSNGQLAAVVIARTQFTVVGLTNGNTYSFQVAPYTLNGEGPLSAAVDVTPDAAGTDAPEGLYDTFAIQLWDYNTGEFWHSTLENNAVTTRRVEGDAGSGEIEIVNHDPVLHDDPEAAGYIPPYSAVVTFTPDEDWYGDSVQSIYDLIVQARAVATTAGGATLATAGALFSTDYLAKYDPPTTPDGEMPEVPEGSSSTGTFTTTDRDGLGETFTWELSADHDGDPKADTSSNSVTVTDADSGDTLGTLTLNVATGLTTTVTFTAADPDWFGTAQAYIRVGDGGVPAEHDGFSAWATVTVSVTSVEDPLSPPTPATMPTIAEDSGFSEQTFSTFTPDWDEQNPGSIGWEISADMNVVRSDSVQVYVGSDQAGEVRIVSEADTDADEDLSAVVRFTPAGDWHGSGSFYIRAVEQSGADDNVSPWTLVSFTVTPVADAPSALYPVTMPTAESAAAPVAGTFAVTDPDSGSVEFQIAATKTGSYSDNVTLANGVTITTVTAGQGPLTQQITATFPEGFAGRYEFWAQAVDSTPLTGPQTRIRGYVAPADLIVELVKLERTATATSLRSLGPLIYTELELDEAETGPGGIEFEVPASQLVSIAESEGMTVADLLTVGLCEVHVIAGGIEVAAGPIVDFEESHRSQSIAITCAGLGWWLRSRMVEGHGTLAFAAADESAVLAGLLTHTQTQQFGDLQLTDGTANVGNTRTLNLQPGTTIVEVAEQMRRELNGADWWVDADRTLRCAQVRGTDRRLSQTQTAAIVLTEHEATVTRRADADGLATVVRVAGDVVSGWGEASQAELQKRGRFAAQFEAPNLGTTDACQALAGQHATNFAAAGEVPRITHYVTATSEIGWQDYGIGDAISLDIETPTGRLRRDVRIVGRRIRPQAYGAAEVDLTVEVVAADGVLRSARSSHAPAMYRQLWAVRNERG